MADLDDLENPHDTTSPDDVAYLSPFAPRVEHTPGDVWHWLDEDLRAKFEAEYWPALRIDEQAAETGQPVTQVSTVVETWWPWAQICAQPGGRAQVERCEREIEAGTFQGVPYDLDGDD
jgi:hypothetical protein